MEELPDVLLKERYELCRACVKAGTACEGWKSGELDIGQAAASCPLGYWASWGEAQTSPNIMQRPRGTVQQPKPVTGRELWAEGHTRTLTATGTDEDKAWFADWCKRVDIMPGCDCRTHWRAYIALNPMDWGNPFAWLVRAHNAVSARLLRQGGPKAKGKRLWTVDEAREWWENEALTGRSLAA